jgi:hypothetical protein
MTKVREPGSSHAALDKFFEQCGGPAAVAELLHITKYHVYKYADPDRSDDIGFTKLADLHRLCHDKQATALVEYLASLAGGVFMPLPQDGSCDIAMLTGDGIMQTAEVGRTVLESVSASSPEGERRTSAELRGIHAEIQDVLRVFGRLSAAVLAEIERADKSDSVTTLRKGA